mgnify:FL=1
MVSYFSSFRAKKCTVAWCTLINYTNYLQFSMVSYFPPSRAKNRNLMREAQIRNDNYYGYKI